MTICVSLLCKKEGAAVVGADRKITDYGLPIEFESSEPKFSLYSSDEVNFVFMSAGSALTPDRIKNRIGSRLDSIRSMHKVMEVCKEEYISIKQSKFEEEFLAPRGISIDEFYSKGLHNSGRGEEWDRAFSKFDLDLDIIVSGVDERGPQSYRISDTDEFGGLVESFAGLGFDTIGTGASLARDSLTSRYRPDLSIKEAIYVVYTALSNASQAPGVGNRYDIGVLDDDIRTLDEEMLTKLQTVYNNNEVAAGIPNAIGELDLE